jgi:hypothetical protein
LGQIDQYPAAGAPTGSEILLEVQAGSARDVKVSNLAVLPAITGAVARAMASRFADSMSLLDFGVTGTGPAADTAAYQVAINACAGKCNLLHPAGLSVTQTAILEVPGDSYLDLKGGLALADGVNDNMLMITGSNVTINVDGVMNGNRAGQTEFGPNNNGTGGIVTQLATFPAIPYTNINVIGTGQINDVYNWPVSINSCKGVLISGITTSGNGNALQVTNGSTEFVITGVKALGEVADFGIAAYQGCSSGVISSCIVDGAGAGIAILNDGALPYDGTTNYYQSLPPHDITVVGNVARNCTSYGILVNNATTLAAATPYANIIDANLIENSGTANTNNAGAIIVGDGFIGGAITNNRARGGGTLNSPWWGIAGAMTYTLIAGNSISDGGNAAAGVRSYGIQPDNLVQCMVIGNFVFDTQATPTMQYGFGSDETLSQFHTYTCCLNTFIANLTGGLFSCATPFSATVGAFFNPSGGNSNSFVMGGNLNMLPSSAGNGVPSSAIVLNSRNSAGAQVGCLLFSDENGNAVIGGATSVIQVAAIQLGNGGPIINAEAWNAVA